MDSADTREFVRQLAEALNGVALRVAVLEMTAKGPLDREIMDGLRRSSEYACGLLHARCAVEVSVSLSSPAAPLADASDAPPPVSPAETNGVAPTSAPV
jgi:hypothetical protein